MKHLQLLLLSLFFPLAIHADGWNGLYQQIEQSIRQPQFANRCFSIEKYGAKASTDSYSIGKDTPLAAANQKAINKAIETCSKAGGGQVIIPAGIYYTGAITMLSHVNLVMEKGATLQFVFEPDLYPQVLTRWEGLDCWNLSPCIYAHKQTDIAIT
ncbi:MAG: glycoside hydrolase, partial [Bacteroidaceae bacterium]|nr:glycoside hydrolase [Bacteroidaceae bacterium]